MTQPRDDKGRFTSDDEAPPVTSGHEPGSSADERIGGILGAIGGVLLAITAIMEFGLTGVLAGGVVVGLALLGWVIGDEADD